jgi:hypothetical protein
MWTENVAPNFACAIAELTSQASSMLVDMLKLTGCGSWLDERGDTTVLAELSSKELLVDAPHPKSFLLTNQPFSSTSSLPRAILHSKN